jgi:hypothetical protein
MQISLRQSASRQADEDAGGGMPVELASTLRQAHGAFQRLALERLTLERGRWHKFAKI